MATSTGKRKIAVLGGGPAAMAAVYGLTSKPNWRDEFEITVYQLGWRLGGKGASGRNADHGQRIEEHGLHIWGGFYWNSFRLMKACYDEYATIAAPDVTMRRIDDAFQPLSEFTWMERTDQGWSRWNVEFATNHEKPWEHDGRPPSLWESLETVLEWMLGKLEHAAMSALLDVEKLVHTVAGWIHDAAGVVERDVAALYRWVASGFEAHDAGPPHTSRGLIGEALRHVRSSAQPVAKGRETHARISAAVGIVKARLAAVSVPSGSDPTLRRLHAVLDLASTIIIGLLKDDIFTKGLEALDDFEYRDWLVSHGISESTLASPAVRSIYDYAFAFRDGDSAKPSLAAGRAINVLNRSSFHYRGSVSWRMNAGMGDTIFSPIYRVLRRRGVSFRFFHRVRKLRLTPDGNRIGAIEIGRQVDLRDPTAEYRPTFVVKGVESWPSQPFLDQIDSSQAEAIRRDSIDLESAWSPWNTTRETPITLELDRDFDDVVLGIPVGALREICGELIEARPAWRAMVDGIATIPTQGIQLWLAPPNGRLGWDYRLPLAIGYAEDLGTYADMSHLLDKEIHVEDGRGLSVAYLCGAYPDPSVIPPFTDYGWPERAQALAEQRVVRWLEQNAAAIFSPPGSHPPDPKSLVWRLIHDPKAPADSKRLNSQYVRINIDPTERYVLSIPGSQRVRMRADGSGFPNLFLAGDWVTTQINAGCVEAAVTAGLLASHAICGRPEEIIEPY